MINIKLVSLPPSTMAQSEQRAVTQHLKKTEKSLSEEKVDFFASKTVPIKTEYNRIQTTESEGL